jgi:peptidylprolyl isomerase
MKYALAIVLALAGLAATAVALQDGGTPTAPATPATPPEPKGIPVPDMPVVKTETLEGGLIVEDLKIGDGYEVPAGGAVVAFYHGTRKTDGHVFDSAFERGEPIGFSLNGVVAGWQKGVPGMKVGGIRRLIVPSAMGYGPNGNGPDIPGNTDLVFVIQVTDALQIEDLKAGEGEAATDSCLAVTVHTAKDKDGKEVEKVEAGKPYIWVPGEFRTQMGFDAMQAGLAGMKIGGKRKVHIPAAFNQPNPGLASNRPGNVALDFEVELVGLRNLPQQGRRR